MAVVQAGQRQQLHERRSDPMALDNWRDRSTLMNKREDVGSWVKLAENLEEMKEKAKTVEKAVEGPGGPGGPGGASEAR